MRWTLKIECLSDTCFSMPATLSVAVDSEAVVDDLGLPLVPGKTVRSLLRDTWLTLLGPYYGEDRTLGYALLGQPGAHADTGLLRIGDARVSKTTRDVVRWARERDDNPVGADAVREAFFAARTLTAVDPETGAPREDTMRRVRVVPEGTVLRAPVSSVQPLDEEHLRALELLLKLTRHAGLDRNRGLGHVRLTLEAREDEDDEPQALSEEDAGDSALQFLHYRLVLTAPCVFRREDLDPNSCSTQRYIPGAAIRGAIAAALVRESAADTLELIASDHVRFLNAYAEVSDSRSVPTPITWQRDKDPLRHDCRAAPEDAVFRLFLENEEADPETQRVPLKAEFCASYGSTYRPASVAVEYHTHQTRSRELGITLKEEEAKRRRVASTTVYVYESLSPGQSFLGSIAAPPHLHARLAGLLKGPLWLGRAARSGYGGAPKVQILGPGPDELGVASAAVSLEPGDPFEVRLTAAAVLRDPETGQHDPWQLGRQVAARFDGAAEVVAACVKGDTAIGFNRLWRTELPRVPCAAAGSVVLLKASRKIEAEEVARLQSEPLGERVLDGYGCFVIAADTDQGLSLEPPAPPGAPPEPTGPAADEIVRAQQRLYRARLRRLLADHAVSLAYAKDTKLAGAKPHLLQRLRIPLRDLGGWQEALRTWLAEPQGDSKASRHLPRETQEKLRRVRVAGRSLHAILLEAAAQGWLPVLPQERGGQPHPEARQCRLLPEEEAARLWQEEKQKLCAFYLDTLLGRLARRAKGEE